MDDGSSIARLWMLEIIIIIIIFIILIVMALLFMIDYLGGAHSLTTLAPIMRCCVVSVSICANYLLVWT